MSHRFITDDRVRSPRVSKGIWPYWRRVHAYLPSLTVGLLTLSVSSA